jgi:hypothetical protein
MGSHRAQAEAFDLAHTDPSHPLRPIWAGLLRPPRRAARGPERVWEKVNPLMYRVHHGQPSLEEIVSCLAEYDDKSRPLRDFHGLGGPVAWRPIGGAMLPRASFAPPACRLRPRDSLVADFFMMHRFLRPTTQGHGAGPDIPWEAASLDRGPS